MTEYLERKVRQKVYKGLSQTSRFPVSNPILPTIKAWTARLRMKLAYPTRTFLEVAFTATLNCSMATVKAADNSDLSLGLEKAFVRR